MAPPGARDVAENEGNPSGLFNLTGTSVSYHIMVKKTQKKLPCRLSRVWSAWSETTNLLEIPKSLNLLKVEISYILLSSQSSYIKCDPWCWWGTTPTLSFGDPEPPYMWRGIVSTMQCTSVPNEDHSCPNKVNKYTFLYFTNLFDKRYQQSELQYWDLGHFVHF